MADLFYARCSTKEQNEARQIEYARELDIEERYIFIDKASGKNTDRPALKELLRTMRNGDTLHITELARLGRSTKDLIDLMDKFEKEGVEVHSKKEAIDTSTPAGRLVFHVFASVAEFQRQLILENAAEGRAAAKKMGKPLGRPKVDQDALSLALHMFQYDKEKSVKYICEKTGISRSTLYREAESRGAKRVQ